MTETLDIHNMDKKLNQAIEFLKKGGVQKKAKVAVKPITEKNIKLILDFYKIRTLDGKSKGTRHRELHMLIIMARMLDKDFDSASKEDIKQLVLRINSSDKYSLWTKCKLRLLFRQFYKWMKFGDDYMLHDEFPEEVRWIKRNFKKSDEPQITSKDILNEDEMKKLIDTAEHPRDKTFISILTESGARIAEIGNLRIKDV